LKFSTKTRYGLRAMIELAINNTSEGVFQKDIAKKQDISLKYLDQIIHSLKVAGLISNVKGKKSGYILTKKSSEISIYEIHRAFENDICVIDCMSSNYHCDRMVGCTVQKFWKGLNQVVMDYFKNTTLEDIVSGNSKFENI
jgi:Rrf2 family protein